MRRKYTGLKHDTEAMESVMIGRGAFCKDEAGAKVTVDETEERMPE